MTANALWIYFSLMTEQRILLTPVTAPRMLEGTKDRVLISDPSTFELLTVQPFILCGSAPTINSSEINLLP